MNNTRRKTLKTLLGTSLALSPTLQANIKSLRRPVKFGLITDTHIGFVSKAEDRLEAFLKDMAFVRPNALIQLGDFANPNAKHQPIVDQFNKANQNVFHAIGNHELDHGLTREDAKKSWSIPAYYYAKEVEGIKVIVLDGNDTGSPTYATHGGYHSYIGKEQRDWLTKELEKTTTPILLVSHQPLAGPGCIDNDEEVRTILQPHKDKILASINGHSHLDLHLEVDGIHYVHINSASYYWLGGTVRLATYKDPLFTTLTIDPAKGTLSFSGKNSSWSGKTPEDANYFADGKYADRKGHVAPQITARTLTK